MFPILDVFENNHLDPPWSYVVVFALDLAMLLLIAHCVREVLRSRKAAADADAVVVPEAPLFEGARFVAGKVELAEGETIAARVTVTQDGSERQHKGSYYHTWTEVERETVMRPFYLRHASGARVRVEPPEDMRIVDKLDQREWHDLARRRLRAELTPGEWAVVSGRLYRAPDPEETGASVGYRSAASLGWVARPSRTGMEVSTESLSKRHKLRERAFLATAGWVTLLGALTNLPLATYRARVFLGRNVVATYLGKKTYTTRNSKGQLIRHWVVDVEHEPKPGHEDRFYGEVDSDDYPRLPALQGEIWIRDVPDFDVATALGRGSSVPAVSLFFTVLILGLALYRVFRTHRHRRWYEGRVIQQGSGKLPPPTTERFVGGD